MRRLLYSLGAVLLLAAPSPAQTWRPARERFGAADVKETPDFQRHVVPLLGRLGCNGRACHGSFQGQGGFRLSLFGHDFGMDHQSLTGKGQQDGTRINLTAPAASLVLRKPTLQAAHRGGKRFDQDGWQHRLLLRWLENGARNVATPLRLERLEVSPAELVFKQPGETATLRVLAHWADGSVEDVTCLCRFQTNDDAIAEIDAEGLVRAKGKGDTHVIAFYDNGVAAVPVLLPVTGRLGDRYPQVPTPTKIDELIVAKLRLLGVVPSELCTDAEFLRRASIDLTGTLPTPLEVEQFLAATTQDKRARKIDALLDSQAYAALWANRLCDFTGNNGKSGERSLGHRPAVQWYSWLYRRVEQNVPYDRLVEGIVLATGRHSGQSYEDYAAETSACFRAKAPGDYAERPTLPYYWTRANLAKPEDKALAFAHGFLGLRLQCAQCHKHPFDSWTQDDFRQFARFFEPIKLGIAPESQADYRRIAQAVGQKAPGVQGAPITDELLVLAEEGKTVPWRELYIEKGRIPANQPLKLLGHVSRIGPDEDPRRAILDWMRRPDNPYFAKAFVNRVWASYFHVGLVEPADDLNLANPPSNRQLLDYLCRDFVEHGYDMKRLHRLIANSHAYQRRWQPNETNRDDRRNYSRAIPRRLPAEVVYDALAQATAADGELKAVRSNLERRAIGHLATFMTGTYAMNLFGKPNRDLACDCERSSQPTLLQAIFLRNDPLLHSRLDDSGWLQDIAQRSPEKNDTALLIRQAYLRTVNRPPTMDEVARAKRHVAEADATVDGLRDLLWALLNSKEFILNH